MCIQPRPVLCTAVYAQHIQDIQHDTPLPCIIAIEPQEGGSSYVQHEQHERLVCMYSKSGTMCFPCIGRALFDFFFLFAPGFYPHRTWASCKPPDLFSCIVSHSSWAFSAAVEKKVVAPGESRKWRVDCSLSTF